jgi:hypothetical protein
MKKLITICAVVAMILAISGLAQAEQLVKLGTAGGGLMIYYNNLDISGAGGVPDGIVSGYDEKPINQAYVKAQFGYSNTNGSPFQFDNTDLGLGGGLTWNSIFSGQPVGQSQFGFDLQGTAASYNGAGGVAIPAVSFADNTNNDAAGALLTNVIPGELQAWAINNYEGGAQSGQLINSLFRGTSYTMAVTNFQVVGNTYVMTISGDLNSDGIFHWYTINQPDSTLASWQLSDKLSYTGTLIYNKDYRTLGYENGTNTYSNGLENGHDQMDFYAGNIDIYVSVVPEPGTLALLGMGGLIALGAMWIRRRRSVTE